MLPCMRCIHFWQVINTTAHHLDHSEPSSPSTKELNDLTEEDMTSNGCIIF